MQSLKKVAAAASLLLSAVARFSNRAPIDTVKIPPMIAAAARSWLSSDENARPSANIISSLAGITLV